VSPDTTRTARLNLSPMKSKTLALTAPEGSQLNAARTPTLTLVEESPRQPDAFDQPVLSLLVADHRYLAAREKLVAGYLKSSVAAAKASFEIYSFEGGRLWRTTHKSFAAYCRERWKMGKAQAYRLVASGAIIDAIETKTSDGKFLFGACAPISETHLRPLQKLDPDKRVDCWLAIVGKNSPADLTEKIVAAETATFAASLGRPITPPKVVPLSDQVKAAVQLGKLRAAVKALPAAAEIEALLTQIQGLLV
jgi:hypothetical protein